MPIDNRSPPETPGVTGMWYEPRTRGHGNTVALHRVQPQAAGDFVRQEAAQDSEPAVQIGCACRHLPVGDAGCDLWLQYRSRATSAATAATCAHYGMC